MRTDTRPAYIKWAYAAGVAIVLGSAGMAMDGPSAQEEAADTAGAVQDGEQASAQLQADYLFALHREQAERPGLWTPEQIARGDVAARIVAHTRQEAP
jgi:hypothetical protein